MPKCKFVKKMKSTVGGQKLEHCYCTSPRGSGRSRYSGISRSNGVNITGSSSAPKSDGNDWTLCVGGRCWQTGATPSKCRYYS